MKTAFQISETTNEEIDFILLFVDMPCRVNKYDVFQTKDILLKTTNVFTRTSKWMGDIGDNLINEDIEIINKEEVENCKNILLKKLPSIVIVESIDFYLDDKNEFYLNASIE